MLASAGLTDDGYTKKDHKRLRSPLAQGCSVGQPQRLALRCWPDWHTHVRGFGVCIALHGLQWLLVLFGLRITVACFAPAENWAQLAGTKAQNTAVAAASPWDNRWGHAVAVIVNEQPSNAEPLPANQRTRIYVLGGETYVTDNVPDTTHYQGTGEFTNDIWRSVGMGACSGRSASRGAAICL